MRNRQKQLGMMYSFIQCQKHRQNKFDFPLKESPNTKRQCLTLNYNHPMGKYLKSMSKLQNALLQLKRSILKKVIQWATYHKDDPPPPEDDENKEKRTDDISSWDADFLKVDQGTLFELILAANYLDIKGLLDVTCKTVANMIKGKTPEEIRKTFNIKNDFTASEEEQVRKENEWCEEK
ncbi:hypothetical protein Trydic_g21193 [Trypoxylus dichotomus]